MKRLSRKLDLEERGRSADGAGGYSGAWVVLGTHWAAVEPSTGRLERGEAVARARGAYRITLRSVPPMSPARPKAGQRFREGTRVYEIRSVVEGGDARHLVCYADEEVAS